MARAAHLWVRHLNPAMPSRQDAADRAFVGGLIAGLCREMRQPVGVENWVIYVYALLDGYGSDALSQSLAVLEATANVHHRDSRERGYAEAPGVTAWLNLPAAAP